MNHSMLPLNSNKQTSAILQQFKKLLIHMLDVKFGLLDELDDVLDEDEIVKLTNEENLWHRAEQLLDLVQETDERPVKFLLALKENDQGHIARFITENGVRPVEDLNNWPLYNTEQWKKIFRNRKLLHEIIDSKYGLLDKIKDAECISSGYQEFIRTFPTYFERNEKLIEALKKRSLTDYYSFIKCLQITNQPHVASLLEPEIAGSVSVLAEKYKNRLSQNCSTLVEYINVDCTDLIERLWSNGCITSHQKEAVKSAALERDRVNLLLEIVERGSQPNFDKFIKALRDTGHDQLVDETLEDDVSVAHVDVNSSSSGDIAHVEQFITNESRNQSEDRKAIIYEECGLKDMAAHEVKLLPKFNMVHSIRLYFVCRSLSGVEYLNSLLSTGKLAKIVQKLFMKLLGDAGSISVEDMAWDKSNYERCIRYFSSGLHASQLPHSYDVEISNDHSPPVNKYVDTIKENYELLRRSLDPNGSLLEHLSVEWSEDIAQKVNTRKTADEKCCMLLNELLRMPTEPVNIFLSILRQIGQDHVANIFEWEDDKIPMSDANFFRFERKHSKLCQFIDPCDDLLDSLVKSGAILESDRSQINVGEEQSYDQMANTLIEILKRKSDCAFGKFLNALDATSQNHVAYILIDKGEQKPIRDEDIKRLDEKWSLLITRLEPVNSELLEQLVSLGAFTVRDDKRVRDEEGEVAQSTRLLRLMKRKSQSSFERFKDALIKSSQKHIALEIFGTDIRAELVQAGPDRGGERDVVMIRDEMREALKIDGTLVARLRQDGLVLSFDEKAQLRFTCLSCSALELLQVKYSTKELDEVLTDHYRQLVHSQSGHSLAVEIPPEEFERCGKEFREEVLMPDAHFQALQWASEELADKMQSTDKLLDQLKLCQRRAKAVKDQANPKDQSRVLLKMLSRSPDHAFMSLINALKSSGQTDIASSITKRSRPAPALPTTATVVVNQQQKHANQMQTQLINIGKGSNQQQLVQPQVFVSFEGFLSNKIRLQVSQTSRNHVENVMAFMQAEARSNRIKLCGTSINCKLKDPALSICVCAANDDLKGIKHFGVLGTGADVDEFFNRTPLWYAAANGHVKMVNYLLKHHAKDYLDYCDNDNASPLYIAAQGGHAKVVRLLMQRNASINTQTVDRQSPLSIACALGHVSVADELLACKSVQLENKDNLGRTPLWFAASLGLVNLVDSLLSKGAAVNCADVNNVSALHAAVYSGHVDIVRSLLAHKADVHSLADNGASPLLVALSLRNQKVIDLIIENGAAGDKPQNSIPMPGNAFSVNNVSVLEQRVKLEPTAENAHVMPAYAADVNESSESAVKQAGRGRLQSFPSQVDDGFFEHDKRDQSSLLPVHNGLSPLWLAAAIGNQEAVRKLISRGADVNVRTESGDTPLHIATYHGHVECVKVLIENRAGINVQTAYGSTPLCFAVERGHVRIVELLLKGGADINKKDKWERKPLWFAVSSGNIEVLMMLLNHPHWALYSDSERATCLYIAVSRRSAEMTRLLIGRGVNVDVPTDFKVSALGLAAERGFPELVELMLLERANVEHRDAFDRTPLWFAAANGRTDVVEILINHKANVNASSIHGLSSLHIASFQGHLESVERLLNGGADKDALTKTGTSALIMAASRGHSDVVKLLLLRKSAVNSCDCLGFTPLMAAAISVESKVDMISLLIENGADVNARTNCGEIALHFTTCTGSVEKTRELLENDSITRASDVSGRTPLHFASSQGLDTIVRTFVQRGADVNSKCDVKLQEITPLYLATQSGHAATVNELLRLGAHVDAKTSFGVTPLMRTADSGLSLVALHLLNAGANVEMADANQHTALYYAAANGHTDVLKMLLNKGANTECCDALGVRPLLISVIMGHLESVAELLKRGANVNAPGKSEILALCDAAMDIPGLLPPSGSSDISVETLFDGLCPLHCAAYLGRSDIARRLLQENADVDIRTKGGVTPFMLAAWNGHIEVIELLVGAGASVTRIDDLLEPWRLHKSIQVWAPSPMHWVSCPEFLSKFLNNNP